MDDRYGQRSPGQRNESSTTSTTVSWFVQLYGRDDPRERGQVLQREFGRQDDAAKFIRDHEGWEVATFDKLTATGSGANRRTDRQDMRLREDAVPPPSDFAVQLAAFRMQKPEPPSKHRRELGASMEQLSDPDVF